MFFVYNDNVSSTLFLNGKTAEIDLTFLRSTQRPFPNFLLA